MVLPGDTTYEVASKRYEVLSRLSLEDRARMTFELSQNLRQILEDGIRARDSRLTDAQVKRQVLAVTLPAELFERLRKDRRL